MNPISGAGPGIDRAAGVQQIIAMRQQIIDKSSLLQQLHGPQGATAPAETNGPAGGFQDALKSALDGVARKQNQAEALTEGYERGEVTDVAKVMLARQEAGVAFEATLQTRNRLLSAYQEIMRMGV